MQTLLFTIGEALTLVGPMSPLLVNTAGTYVLTAAGGTAPYRIELVSETFPAEWSIDAVGTEDVTLSTGEALEAGSYSVTYRVTDSNRNVRLVTRTLQVIALPFQISGSLDAMTVGAAYSDSLPVSGGIGDYTLVSSVAPDGITVALASTDGPITFSGIPSGIEMGVAGSITFDVMATVRDSSDPNLTAVYTQSVTINALSIATMLAAGPVYIAHGAASLRYPEETTWAYSSMRAARLFAVEQDVRLNADGSLVVSHDADATYATTSTSNYSGLSVAQILALTVDEDVWFGVDYPSNTIPIFLGVLNGYKGTMVFFPEIKAGGGSRPLLELQSAAIPLTQAVVSSFTASDLTASAAAGYPTMLNGINTSVLATVLSNGFDYVAYRKDSVSARFTDAVAAGIPPWAYTVNRRHERDTLLGYGVVGMYSDDPEYLATDDPIATADTFADQDWMAGMIPNKAANESRPTATERGRFSSPDYWGFADSGASTYQGVLMGWACPIDGDPTADEYQITFTAKFGAPSDADQTRWAGLFVSDGDEEFMDIGSGNVSPNGYHFLARKAGTLQIYRIDAPNTATLLAENGDSDAIVDDAEHAFRVVVTPTSMRLERLDGSGNVVHSVTTGDTTANHRGGYFHLGHSRLPMHFRDVATAEIADDIWTPFDFTSNPDLVLCEDSPLTLVSGVVSQCNDISGNGWHVTQSTAGDRPTPVDNNLNDHRVLDFDSSDYFAIPAGALSLFQNKTKAVALAVVRQDVTDGAGADRIVVSFATNAAASRFGLFTGTAAAKNRASVGGRRLDSDSFASATSATERPATWLILVGIADYANRTLTLRVNGIQDAQTTGAWTGGGSTSNTASLRARVGAGVGTSPAGFRDGKGAYLALFDSEPSLSEIEKWEGWAARKYGLLSDLDAGHPYKSVVPMR